MTGPEQEEVENVISTIRRLAALANMMSLAVEAETAPAHSVEMALDGIHDLAQFISEKLQEIVHASVQSKAAQS